MGYFVHHHIGGLENNHGFKKSFVEVHHHIGGLESLDVSQVAQTSVHHHIGGLEITIKFKIPIIIVHHHIGGLEIIFVKPARGNTSSPPHRWLRKVSNIIKSLRSSSPPHRWLRNVEADIVLPFGLFTTT